MMNRNVQRLPMICIMAIGLTMLVPALAKQEGKGAGETKGKAAKAKGGPAKKAAQKGPAPAEKGKEAKQPQKDAKKAKGPEPSAKKPGKKEGAAGPADEEKGEGLALGEEKKEPTDTEGDKDVPESAAMSASGGPKEGWAQGKIAKEQSKHMWRLARIERLAKLGEETGKTDLVEKMGELKEKEQQRYEKAMERLKTEKGKRPGHGQRLGPGTGPGNRDGSGPGTGQGRGPGPGQGHGPGHGKGLHGPGHGQGPGTGPAPGPQGHGAGKKAPKGGAE
jgi:hypothetical protein